MKPGTGDNFDLEWGASFPLEGEIQTVPRAELFTILTLLKNLQPNATVINQILTKELQVTIHWVQGHLDTKDAYKWFPPLWRALNIGADYFANIAAKKFALANQITDLVQSNCSLVSRIQKRLVRILCAFPKSPRKTIEPKSKVPRPVFSPLEDDAAKSSHQLTWNDTAKGWRCCQCAAFGAKSSTTIRPWLAAKCIPVPSDAKGPVRLPFGIPPSHWSRHPACISRHLFL